jgi:hypothetical protein
MTAPDPTADARQVAVELARTVGRVSSRGDLPESFADQLLAPEADGALAILLDTADTAQRGQRGDLGPGLLARLADGLITSADRVSRSRAVVPLVESLRHHPEVAAELLAREEVVDALVGGPRRPRLDRALVRVLQAVAPLRSPTAVANVVRRLGRPGVDLDRLAQGVTALLVECFDDLAGLSLGVECWSELSTDDLTRMVSRLHAYPVEMSRLSTRCAEHGRARMLVALANDPSTFEESLGQAVRLFAVLAPRQPAERRAYLEVVWKLMRVTALQLLLEHRPEDVPGEVADAWACEVTGPEQGERLPVGRLDRPSLDALLGAMDQQGMLLVPEPTNV